MSYCSNCGAEIGSNVNFCSNCGATVARAADPTSEHPTRDSALATPPRQVRTVGTLATTNTMAIASLVSALLWLGGLGSLLAILLGGRAKREIRESRGLQSGETLATTGIVLGWLGIAALLLILLGLIASSPTSSLSNDQSLSEVDRAGFRLEMDSSLEDAARAEEEYAQSHEGVYAESLSDLDLGTPFAGVSLSIAEGGPDGFCIEATHESLPETRHISSDEERPRRGTCA